MIYFFDKIKFYRVEIFLRMSNAGLGKCRPISVNGIIVGISLWKYILTSRKTFRNRINTNKNIIWKSCHFHGKSRHIRFRSLKSKTVARFGFRNVEKHTKITFLEKNFFGKFRPKKVIPGSVVSRASINFLYISFYL